MSDLAVDVELLEPVLRDFVELIGLAATLVLVEKFGGTRIYVPVNATPDHPLTALIGYDKLAALGPKFGAREHFRLPKAMKALLGLRDARIRADRTSKSIRQLALEHQISERRVHQIVGEETDIDQKDFFS